MLDHIPDLKILVLISGGGTNLKALLEACDDNVLPGKIIGVISNKSSAGGLDHARHHHVPAIHFNIKDYFPQDDPKPTREQYDAKLVEMIQDKFPTIDLIILAGWMRIVSPTFLNGFPNKVINLHPSLPGRCPGVGAMEKEYVRLMDYTVNDTGSMIHYVDPGVDTGEVLHQTIIKRNPDFDDQSKYMSFHQQVEKSATINGVFKYMQQYYVKQLHIEYRGFEPRTQFDRVLNTSSLYDTGSLHMSHRGKLRDIYHHPNPDYIVFLQTDRLSAFDRHVCEIPGRGFYLTQINDFWMNQLKMYTDIPVSQIASRNNLTVAKKCYPIMIEVIVRKYATGSLWKAYEQGQREYCGITFPDNLKQNQELPKPVITPTTKAPAGEHDKPISEDDIYKMGLTSKTEWTIITLHALKAFQFIQDKLDELDTDLILVDTKFEFGIDPTLLQYHNICLIDEIGTPDGCRLWTKSTYQEKFDKGETPDRSDKDIAREYLKANPDHNGPLPQEIQAQLLGAFETFYRKLGLDKNKSRPEGSFQTTLNTLTWKPSNITNQDVLENYPIHVNIWNVFADHPNQIKVHDQTLAVLLWHPHNKLSWGIKHLQESLRPLKVRLVTMDVREHPSLETLSNLIHFLNHDLGQDVIYMTTIPSLSNILNSVDNRPLIYCPKFDSPYRERASLSFPDKVHVSPGLEKKAKELYDMIELIEHL